MKLLKFVSLSLLIILSGCTVNNIQNQVGVDVNPNQSSGYMVGSFYYSERDSAARLALEIINTETNEEYLIELKRPKAYSGVEIYPFPLGEYRLTNLARLSGIGELTKKHELVISDITKPFTLKEEQVVYIGHFDGKTTRDVMTILFGGPAFASNDTQSTKIYTIEKEKLLAEIKKKYPSFSHLQVDTPFTINPVSQQNESRPF